MTALIKALDMLLFFLALFNLYLFVRNGINREWLDMGVSAVGLLVCLGSIHRTTYTTYKHKL